MKEEIISRVPLFATLPRNEIRNLAQSLKLCEVSENTLLLHEGEKACRYFILVEGQVEVIKSFGTADERLLAVRQPGSFLGEMSLFNSDERHTASVRARTALQLLEFTRRDLDALLHRQPTIVYELVRTLSRRLDESENLTIRDLREKNRQLLKAYQELEAAQFLIIEKEKMERELEVAREIQMSILPRSMPERPGFDFSARIIPMSAVGGDFFDFINIDNNTLGIVVGDVSGHGVPAALFMTLTVTLIRAESRRFGSPCEVLRSVNRHLLEMNETGMFVTVLYGILDCANHGFEYARAGHELPRLLDNSGEMSSVDHGLGQPLGLFSDPAFDEHRIALCPEDLLLMYSDGVTEAIDTNGRSFGLERLEAVLHKGYKKSAQEICNLVWDSLVTFRGECVQHDDVTMLVVKVG